MVYHKNMICRATSMSSAKNTSHFSAEGIRMCPFSCVYAGRVKRFGMSLLEVLIGITILGFSIGPLLMLFQQASKSLNDDGKTIQALFLTEKILSEIKAGVNRDNNFLYNVPFRRQFQIIKKKNMAIYQNSVPEFLQNIHGYGKSIDTDSQFYNQYEKFWIIIRREVAGQKQNIITVNTSWKEKKTMRNIKLSGLVETTPNKFSVNAR